MEAWTYLDIIIIMIIIIIIISFFKVDFYITFYNYEKPINVNQNRAIKYMTAKGLKPATT